jgi:hypothetical protein
MEKPKRTRAHIKAAAPEITAPDLTNTDPLPEIAARIKADHEELVATGNRMVVYAMAIGDHILEAQKHVSHGEWMSWLAANCPFSDRKARLYVQLAKGRETIEAKLATVANLTLHEAVAELARADEDQQANEDPQADEGQRTDEGAGETERGEGKVRGKGKSARRKNMDPGYWVKQTVGPRCDAIYDEVKAYIKANPTGDSKRKAVYDAAARLRDLAAGLEELLPPDDRDAPSSQTTH